MQNQVLAKLLCQVDKELVEVARRDTSSVLRFKDFNGMSTLSFTEIIKEIQTLCPTVFNFLSQMILLSNSPEKKTVPLALLYGIIMFSRCKEMSRLQRVNTVLLTEGDASQELVDRLHRYGICLSKSMKYTIQEEIGKHFLDGAVQLLKEGRTFVFVLDNIDWGVKVRDMRAENQNKSIHAVATSIVFDHITSGHLPNDGPKKNLTNCVFKDLLTLTEIDLLQENRNKDIEKQINIMGANKTDKAIDRSSRSSGGERLTVENFDHQVNRGVQSSSHTHQSSAVDEEKVLDDLQVLKPFNSEADRKYDSFEGIMADPLATLDELELDKWLRKHKKNLLLDAPILQDEEDEP